MIYRDPIRDAIRREQKDVELFESVGLPWLAAICRRKAERLQTTTRRLLRPAPMNIRAAA